MAEFGKTLGKVGIAEAKKWKNMYRRWRTYTPRCRRERILKNLVVGKLCLEVEEILVNFFFTKEGRLKTLAQEVRRKSYISERRKVDFASFNPYSVCNTAHSGIEQ